MNEQDVDGMSILICFTWRDSAEPADRKVIDMPEIDIKKHWENRFCVTDSILFNGYSCSIKTKTQTSITFALFVN